MTLLEEVRYTIDNAIQEQRKNPLCCRRSGSSVKDAELQLENLRHDTRHQSYRKRMNKDSEYLYW